MGEETVTGKQEIVVSRRALVRSLGAGAVVLTATHLGVAYQAGQWAKQEPTEEIAKLRAELDRLRGLVVLYESLEKVGVDAVIAAGMNVVRGLLDTTRSGLAGLANGVSIIENLLAGFQSTFGVIRDGLTAVENSVKILANLIGDAQKFVGDVTSPVKPLAIQLKDFFDSLISKIPFGVGDNFKRAIDSLVTLLTEIPNSILVVNSQLIEPLRANWFSDSNAKNLQGALIDPITKNVLEPAKAQLKNFDQTLAQWEKDFRLPVQKALDQRADIRQQITDYKKKNGM
jgi:hypothetical protein